jgi:hypothetical protein
MSYPYTWFDWSDGGPFHSTTQTWRFAPRAIVSRPIDCSGVAALPGLGLF